MTKLDDNGGEPFSRLFSTDEESRLAVPTAPFDSGAARRLARTKRCLQLLDEVWPPADQRHPALRLPSQRIDRFDVVRELGRGGFGIVYLADDPKLGREVALKVQRPETVLSGELRRRFLREAKTAAILGHPNIVAVYDAEVAGVQCWIATEYCRGT